MLCCTIHYQWVRKPKTAHSFSDFVTLPEEDRATATGNMHKNLVKIAHAVLEISSRADRQTPRHTHYNTSQPLPRAKKKTSTTLIANGAKQSQAKAVSSQDYSSVFRDIHHFENFGKITDCKIDKFVFKNQFWGQRRVIFDIWVLECGVQANLNTPLSLLVCSKTQQCYIS